MLFLQEGSDNCRDESQLRSSERDSSRVAKLVPTLDMASGFSTRDNSTKGARSDEDEGGRKTPCSIHPSSSSSSSGVCSLQEAALISW